MAEAIPILTFSLGEQLFALPIEHVIEVAAMVELAAVPGARPELLGIANRHGKPLPVWDLRRILVQAERPVGADSLFIVGEHEGQAVGLVVDQIHQVEHVDATQVRATPSIGKYIHGIISCESGLIQLVSLPSLLDGFSLEMNQVLEEKLNG